MLVAWGEGVVRATDARTGEGLWSTELPELTEPAGVLGKVVVARDARDKGQTRPIGSVLPNRLTQPLPAAQHRAAAVQSGATEIDTVGVDIERRRSAGGQH